MKFYGDIDLRENELQQLVMQSETQFPEVPKVGRIVFKDAKLYMCVELNGVLPIWIPLTNTINTFLHDQTVASTVWTITHNLNTVSPLVQVYDENHLMLIPDSVEPLSNNAIRITFSNNQIGTAILMYGDLIPDSGVGVLEPESVAYTETFSSIATIVINHNLGYKPIVRMFIGGEEIQPQSIIHDSIFQTTVTLSSPQTGVIRLI